NLNVPPTLVSFAVATENAKNIQSGDFKQAGSSVYCLFQKYTDDLTPDWDSFKENASKLYQLNKDGKIRAMYSVLAGGIAEAVSKMAFGNKIGVELKDEVLPKVFDAIYGSIIIEADDSFAKEIPGLELIGKTIAEKEIRLGSGASISIDEAEKAWEGKLAKVFPPVSGKDCEKAVLGSEKSMPDWASKVHESVAEARKNINSLKSTSTAKPKVVLPVFPGTNCEFDMARAFALAGADPKIIVFKNYSKEALEDSLNELEKEIRTAQIFALSGGFSCGDEPDGSGKFIANVLRENRVADSIMDLLKMRDGLVLGICNGFQALIKVGLVPYGEIKTVTEDMPTLTFNTIGRHISRVARTRLTSATSPWALNEGVLAEGCHMVPISHGEGRIIISNQLAKELFNKGQVFTQYCDENGNPAIYEPDNPNGSAFAIEGLTSPDGRVLGKMGHSERTVGMGQFGESDSLLKNIGGNKNENIFASGVRYFN
ncbi:MAG: phosphoribosylformylglycinamidine synthase subunit PurQ, partial [Treponemataceae bacterium]|nr:phosphoribosylformylglycinamidine synthase subunit PurQ [Treponemataceae bacterium]